ncbi:hypothetical protein PORY_000327 [Pneumocystis oryctolagi]|uniref:Uncharacterized protein n=1 Tax=Pneumocystis oryctolagi TaxID=42067 RepID=A0ACB7CEZ9_9ASCO|nr:hypothetical protein PORY_000327 [Pneumocystis oryctolagi]
MSEDDIIFKNKDGTRMGFFLLNELVKNELLKHIIQIYGGCIVGEKNEKNKLEITLGDPLKHYLTSNIVSYHFILDSVNCKKLLDINEYYLDISESEFSHRLENGMKNDKKFSKKDIEILINHVHRPGIKRYDMEIYDEISKMYGKHSSYVWHDYYRFVLEPKLGPISFAEKKNEIESKVLSDNEEDNFNNNIMSLERLERRFTPKDQILINFVQNSNLPHTGRLVFEKFHNLYPHRSCISWRNHYLNVLLPLLNRNFSNGLEISDFSYDIFLDKSKKHSSNFKDSKVFSSNSDALFHNKSNDYGSIDNSFTDSVKDSLSCRKFQTQFCKSMESTFNSIESDSKYGSNFEDKKSKKTNLSYTTYVCNDSSENAPVIEYSNFLNNSNSSSVLIDNKISCLEYFSPFKRQKILKEFSNNLENEELVPDEDDIMMLCQLVTKDDQDIRLLKEQEEINKFSFDFDKNMETIQDRQKCLTPINTDEISHLSIISIDSTTPKSHVDHNLQTPKFSSSLTSTPYLDDNIPEEYQEVSRIPELSINQNLSPNSSVSNSNINQFQLSDNLDFDIQNIDSYNFKNDGDLTLNESDIFLEKTASWYLKNMKKYGITQEDVTFALYRTSGVKKLAVIVMEAISKNLPLPNIEGIWTEEDDLIVYGGSSKQLKQVDQKHGGKLHNRIKFLQDYLEEN